MTPKSPYLLSSPLSVYTLFISSYDIVPLCLLTNLCLPPLGVSASSQALITGSQFLTTGLTKRFLTGGTDRRLTSVETVGSALVGGGISGLICGPMELVMIQQQQQGGSIFATAQRLVRRHGGLRAFTRGLGPAIVREGAYCCGYLGIAPAMSRLFEDYYVNNSNYNNNNDFGDDDVNNNNSSSSSGSSSSNEGSGGARARILGALVGGVFAGVVSHPFDTIKTCLQADVERKTYRTMADVVRQVQFRGLFLGVAWRSSIIVSATLLINIFKDWSAPLMFPSKF